MTAYTLDEWRQALADDEHAQPHFVPEWLDALGAVPLTALFGADESRAELRMIVDVLSDLLLALTRFARSGEPPFVFAFRTQHALVVATLSSRGVTASAFQLLRPPAGAPPALAHSVRCLHIDTQRDHMTPTHTVEMLVPSKPDAPSASVHLTHDLAKALDALVLTHQYDTDEIIDQLDADVERALSGAQARSYTLLRLIGNEPFATLDLLPAERRRRSDRVARVLTIANSVAQRGGGAREAAERARAEIRAAGGDIAFDLVREVAAVFYRQQLAHMRVLPVEQWATSAARVVVPVDVEQSIGLDESTTLADFLRRLVRTLSMFAAHLPPQALPLAIVVGAHAAAAPRPGNVGVLDAEAKHGVLVVHADTLSFVQLGVYDGQTMMRKLLVDWSHGELGRVTVTQLPVDAPFDALRGLDARYATLDESLRAKPLGDAIRQVATAGVDAGSLRRGAALAPLLDQTVEAMLTESVYIVTDMYGLLVFAHAFARAPAAERAVMARLYRNYTPALREYVRQLVAALYRSYDLDQYAGSDSSTESDTTTSEARAARTGSSSSGAKNSIRLTHELAMSRVKRKKPTSSDDDEAEEGGEDDMQEDAAASQSEELTRGKDTNKRARVDERVDTRDAEGNELDDDELENIVPAAEAGVPPPSVPTSGDAVAYATHDLVARVVFDLVARNRPSDVAALQSVERSFARVLQFVDSDVFADLWRNKYPLLALEFNGQMPFSVMGVNPHERRSSRLLVELHLRFDELRGEIDRVETAAKDIRRNIEHLAPVVAFARAGAVLAEGGAEGGADFARHIDALEAQLRASAALLTDARAALSALEAQRDTARQLIDRYEGRPLTSLSGRPTEVQQRAARANRAWTLLLSIVDNFAHHPATREHLLARGLRSGNIVSLKTVDADRLDGIVRRASPNYGVQDIGSVLAHSVVPVYQGRYYVARFAAHYSHTEESIALRVAIGDAARDGAAIDEWTLLVNDDSTPPFSQAGEYVPESIQLAVDESVERATPAELDAARQRWAGAALRARTYFAAQTVRQASAVDDAQHLRGAPLRVAAARFWRSRHASRVAPSSPFDRFAPAVADGEMSRDARRYIDHGMLSEFTAEYSLVAVDHALFAGLYAMAAQLPLFYRLASYAPIASRHREIVLREAGDLVSNMVATGEIGPDEDTGEAFDHLVRDAERQPSDFSTIDWRRAFSSVMRAEKDVPNGEPTLASTIIHQVTELFHGRYGTPDAYVRRSVSALASTATSSTTAANAPVRRFRRVEYDFFLYLFTALVIKRILFYDERFIANGFNVRNGVQSPLARLYGQMPFLAPPFRRRLKELARNVHVSIGDELDEQFVGDVGDAERRRELEARLRSIGLEPTRLLDE